MELITAAACDALDVETFWGPEKKDARVLSLRDGDVEAGSADFWLKYAEDEDEPYIRLGFVRVDEPYQGTEVGLDLLRVVANQWPAARVIAGPVSADEPKGPKFRLRCWDAGLPIHDDHCERDACRCRNRVVAEVIRRWEEWAAEGGITQDELAAKVAKIQKEEPMVDISGFEPPYICMVVECEEEATVELERQVGDIVTRDLRLCPEHADQGSGHSLTLER